MVLVTELPTWHQHGDKVHKNGVTTVSKGNWGFAERLENLVLSSRSAGCSLDTDYQLRKNFGYLTDGIRSLREYFAQIEWCAQYRLCTISDLLYTKCDALAGKLIKKNKEGFLRKKYGMF